MKWIVLLLLLLHWKQNQQKNQYENIQIVYLLIDSLKNDQDVDEKQKQAKKKIQEKNHYIHKSIVVYILHFFFSHEWKRMQMGQQRNNDEWKKPNLWKIRLNYKYMNINIINKWKNNNNKKKMTKEEKHEV